MPSSSEGAARRELPHELRIERVGSHRRASPQAYGQRPHDGHTLLLPTGELIGIVPHAIRKSKTFKSAVISGRNASSYPARGAVRASRFPQPSYAGKVVALKTIPIRRRTGAGSRPGTEISSPSRKISPSSMGSSKFIQRRRSTSPPEAPIKQTICPSEHRAKSRHNPFAPNFDHSGKESHGRSLARRLTDSRKGAGIVTARR